MVVSSRADRFEEEEEMTLYRWLALALCALALIKFINVKFDKPLGLPWKSEAILGVMYLTAGYFLIF